MSIPNSRERSRLNQWLGTTPYNPSHNISEICNATGKTKVDIYQKNVVQKLPHKLLKDVRLRTIKNQEIIQKFWEKTAKSLVSLAEIKPWKEQSKST